MNMRFACFTMAAALAAAPVLAASGPGECCVTCVNRKGVPECAGLFGGFEPVERGTFEECFEKGYSAFRPDNGGGACEMTGKPPVGDCHLDDDCQQKEGRIIRGTLDACEKDFGSMYLYYNGGMCKRMEDFRAEYPKDPIVDCCVTCSNRKGVPECRGLFGGFEPTESGTVEFCASKGYSNYRMDNGKCFRTGQPPVGDCHLDDNCEQKEGRIIRGTLDACEKDFGSMFLFYNGGMCKTMEDFRAEHPKPPAVHSEAASAPPDCCDPELANDPHLKSWRGEWFDYHGECDLKLLRAPSFDGKQDMDIHVRTTIKYDYSYIEAAALRIGENILEVGSYGDYALNGVEGALRTDAMVPKIGGYQVYYTMVNKKRHIFDVVIAENENVTITTFKDWVSVKVFHGDEQRFGAVSGLMGNYYGKMLGRNGTNLHDDINALGQDWQVLPEEGTYFRTVRAPQYPEKCNLPSPNTKISRRLGEKLAQEAAQEACSHLTGARYSFCVHDVMATGDLEIAKAGVL